MEGGPSEQRYMDVACERFRTDGTCLGISVRNAWRTTPPAGELSVWEYYSKLDNKEKYYGQKNISDRRSRFSGFAFV